MQSELLSAIRQAKAQGMQVVLRGGLWSVTETTFMPSDIATFFSTFGDSHKYWAQIAEAEGVLAYGIGVEMELLEGNENSAYWQSIISKVRSQFSGIVWYATNWWDSKVKGDKKRNAVWMKSLDLICISCYPMLVLASWYTSHTYPATPSVAELNVGYLKFPYWGSDSQHSFKGTNLVTEFQSLADAHGKQLLVHMGCASVWTAAYRPWFSPPTGQADIQGQANWYTAFFETFGTAPFIDGWLIDGAWFPVLRSSVNPATNLEFTIQNKVLTEQAVETAFATLSPIEPPHPVTYVVDIATALGGTTNPTGSHTVETGTVMSITATPAEGYKFNGWQVQTDMLVTYPDTVNPLTLTITAATTVMPLFSRIPEPPTCLEGFHWDETVKACVPDKPTEAGGSTVFFRSYLRAYGAWVSAWLDEWEETHQEEKT